jgi:hypothetical protein
MDKHSFESGAGGLGVGGWRRVGGLPVEQLSVVFKESTATAGVAGHRGVLENLGCGPEDRQGYAAYLEGRMP